MKILVTSTFITPFISQDLELLRKHFEVAHLRAHGPSAPLAIAAGVRKADLVYTWFASTYAAAAVFAARRKKIPSMIALGGADVAAIPSLGYGIWRSPWRARLVGYALRNADRVLAVDPFLKEEASRRAGYDGRNIDTLPTGFDPEVWSPAGSKERLVLTVAVCDTVSRLKIKGIDLLCEAAARLPAVPFTVVGVHEHLIEGLHAPANVTIRGTVSREELLGLYRRAKVYCQPSVIEGLPNAVCEAMLCGCFPVGTDVGGMKSAINGAGLLVPHGDAAQLAEALRAGLASPPAASGIARSSIAERFTLRRREDGLVRTIIELLA